MQTPRPSLLWITVLAVACQGPTQVTNQRPGFVPEAQFTAARWVALKGEEDQFGMGSAVIVGPRHLVTNAHVWAKHDPWWAEPLQAEGELVLRGGHSTRKLRMQDGVAKISAYPPLVVRQFRKVASGEAALVAEPGGQWTMSSQEDGDWVLLETDGPTWTPKAVAPIHPPALEPSWYVPDGTELYVLGFSSIFRIHQVEGSIPEGVLLAFLRKGPYTLTGHSKVIDGIRTISYGQDWPVPLGHSGGGVFLWCEERGQLELVGLFHSAHTFTNHRTQTFALLGLSALSFDWEMEREEMRLVYSPIAPAIAALPAAED